MKTSVLTLIKLSIIFSFFYSYSQDINFPNTRKQLKDSTFSNYVNNIKSKDKDSKLVFSGSMLNNLFKGELSSFFTNTKDFALDSYFITTDSDAKTLTIGGSKNLDDLFGFTTSETKNLNKLSHIGAIYVRSSFDNNFSKLSSKNSETEKFEFNSGIGVGLKYTYLGKGSIAFNKSSAKKFEELRKSVIKSKIQKEIETYNTTKFLEEFEEKVLDEKLSYLIKNAVNFDEQGFEIQNYKFPDDEIKKDSIEAKIIRKQYFVFLENLIDKEIELLKESKLFNAYRTNWISVEAFYPLTAQSFNTSPNDSTAFTAKDFNDWRLSLGFNFLRSNSLKDVFRVSFISSMFNNNNFLAQNISSKSFQNITNSTDDFQVLGTSNKVFVGEYDEFASLSFKGEMGYLFRNTVGFSAAIERTLDKFNVTNWKLAIPFSLIDKDDKPTVNFELQWKETYGEHVLGIGIGYVFGRYLK